MLPILPCNVSVRNSICDPEKPIVKFACKYLFKTVNTANTSSVLPGKPISDSNVMFLQVN